MVEWITHLARPVMLLPILFRPYAVGMANERCAR